MCSKQVIKRSVLPMLIFILSIHLQAQEKIKDTLFFKIDNSYLLETKNIPKTFFLKDGNKSEEFCFSELAISHNLKPTKVLDLKYFIRNSKFYLNKGSRKLDNWKLVKYFSDYQIFLVREKENETDYIKVDTAIMAFD